MENHCAKEFKAKSWVRLQKPDGRKFGGGERVKRVRMFDNWNVMSNNTAEEQHYGQEYYYNAKGVAKDVSATDGVNDLEQTSGVATMSLMQVRKTHWCIRFMENTQKIMQIL